MAAAGAWLRSRLRRRMWPLVVAVLTAGLGTAYPIVFTYRSGRLQLWSVPGDLWGTYRAAHFVGWGDFGGIYAAHGGLVTFPGILLALTPMAMVTGALGLSENFPYPLPHPSAWLALGPYEMLLSAVALFACDRLAERLGVGRGRRFVLAVAGGLVLANVDVVWGHPEDAVAVGLAVYSLVLALDGRWVGAGWLFGAALATQPLVVLMLPVVAARVPWRAVAPLLVRSALPALALLAAPLAANFHATVHAIVQQPNFPRIDHVTPWTQLAPVLGGTGRNLAVAAGPGRLVAVALAVGVGWWCRRRNVGDTTLVWAAAAALALRSLTESVMVPYYVWPALAVALVAAVAGAGRLRIAAGAAVALFVTYIGNVRLPGWVPWWVAVVGGLVVVQALTAPATQRERRSRSGAGVPEIPETTAEHPPPPVPVGLQ